MKASNILVIIPMVLSSFLLAAAPAWAQRITYDFDDLALNTPVTNQYDGVVFSVLPQSCSGSPTLYMRTRVPSGGTSSGTRAIGIDTGCPDFSPDYLRMVFDNPQGNVSFVLGDYALTFTVRAYSSTSGSSGLLSTQSIVLEGSGPVGVHRLVTVLAAGNNIRRVEVESPIGLFEWIDDLSFDLDTTPPVARISAPVVTTCVCTSVQIMGSANDPDGTYLRDRAEYRPAASDTWTLIGEAMTPVDDGPLYVWNTSGLTEGFHFVKLTVTNSVGLESSDTTLVWISRDFDSVSFVVPAVVGGIVCPDGTAWDEYCSGEYTVMYSSGGPYQPIDAGHPSYPGYRVNEALGAWNTAALGDGPYTLRVAGSNTCGHSLSVTHPVTIDNTRPVTIITTPTSCSSPDGTSLQIRGTVTDAHLGAWSLQYTGGPSHGWTTIASGAAPVVNGLLGTLNISSLPDCQYTIRLVAEDTAVRGCDAAIHNHNEYTVTFFIGCEADFNGSGEVNSQDFFDFLTVFFSGCP